MSIVSKSPEDFQEVWDGCIVDKLQDTLSNLPNGSNLEDAIDTLFAAMAESNLSGMILEAMGQMAEADPRAVETTITLLTLELEFLCHYEGSEGIGSPGFPPTVTHATAAKAKIIIASLLAILPLRPAARRLLHILMELLDLAQ